MSVQLHQTVAPQRLASGFSSLRWPIGLACAVAVPLLLPIPGSPVTLAGFVGVIVTFVLLARHWLLAVLPPLAILGAHFLPLQAMGVNIFGFRLAIILLALFSTPLTTRGDWWFNPVARRAVLFMALWVSWGLLSLLWTPDVGGGIGDVITLVFGLGLLLTLLSLGAHKAEHLDKLRFGWLLGLVLAAMGALFEIVRGIPLPDDASLVIAGPSAALGAAGFDPAIRSTLGYSSNFGGFLLLTVPFVLWSLARAGGPARLAYLSLLAIIPVLVLYSASRIALLGLMVQLAFYALVLHRRWYMPLLVAVAGLGAVASYSVLLDSNLKIAQKLEKVEQSGRDASASHRMALTLNGMWMAYKTAGAGVGAGGYEEEISGDVPIRLVIRRIDEWNAHNFWIEVLSEYGVLVFGAFMALLGWIGLLGWRAQRKCPLAGRPEELARVGRAVLVGLAGYLFYAVAGGTAVPHAAHWIFLTTLFVMGACLYEQLGSARPRP